MDALEAVLNNPVIPFIGLGVTVILICKNYIDMYFEFSAEHPRPLALAYLLGAIFYVFLMSFIALTFPPVPTTFQNLYISRSAFTFSAITMLFGPFLVFAPMKPIQLQEKTVFNAIVTTAHKKEVRIFNLLLFAVVTAMQVISVYSLFVVMDYLGLALSNILGTILAYALICVFYLIVFFGLVTKRRIVIREVDVLNQIRMSISWQNSNGKVTLLLATVTYTKMYLVFFFVALSSSIALCGVSLWYEMGQWYTYTYDTQVIIVVLGAGSLITLITYSILILQIAFNPVPIAKSVNVHGMEVAADKIQGIVFALLVKKEICESFFSAGTLSIPGRKEEITEDIEEDLETARFDGKNHYRVTDWGKLFRGNGTYLATFVATNHDVKRKAGMDWLNELASVKDERDISEERITAFIKAKNSGVTAPSPTPSKKEEEEEEEKKKDKKEEEEKVEDEKNSVPLESEMLEKRKEGGEDELSKRDAATYAVSKSSSQEEKESEKIEMEATSFKKGRKKEASETLMSKNKDKQVDRKRNVPEARKSEEAAPKESRSASADLELNVMDGKDVNKKISDGIMLAGLAPEISEQQAQEEKLSTTSTYVLDTVTAMPAARSSSFSSSADKPSSVSADDVLLSLSPSSPPPASTPSSSLSYFLTPASSPPPPPPASSPPPPPPGSGSSSAPPPSVSSSFGPASESTSFGGGGSVRRDEAPHALPSPMSSRAKPSPAAKPSLPQKSSSLAPTSARAPPPSPMSQAQSNAPSPSADEAPSAVLTSSLAKAPSSSRSSSTSSSVTSVTASPLPRQSLSPRPAVEKEKKEAKESVERRRGQAPKEATEKKKKQKAPERKREVRAEEEEASESDEDQEREEEREEGKQEAEERNKESPAPSKQEAVFVKTLTGKTITVDLDLDEDSATLKQRVFLKEGIPTDQQRLIVSGHQIEGGKTLREAGVTKEGTVHLVLRLRGGPTEGSLQSINVSNVKREGPYTFATYNSSSVELFLVEKDREQRWKDAANTLIGRDIANLSPLLGRCDEGGNVYAVTKAFTNGSLLSLIKSQSLEVNMCIRAAKQLAWCLLGLEQASLVHINLCLNAIRVSVFGAKYNFHLSELSMIRQTEDGVYQSLQSERSYSLSPSEVRDRGLFSVKSVMWQWSVIVWQIFTRSEVVPGSPLSQPSSCPKELFSVLVKCFEEKHENRPSGFAEIVTAIDEL